MTELTSVVHNRQVEAERLFAASTFSAPDRALEYCGWLSPETFQDERIKRYWAGLLGHHDAIKAALEAGIQVEILEWMTGEIFEYAYDPRPFASALVEEAWLYSLSAHLSPLAQAIAGRNLEEAGKILATMGQRVPGANRTIPDSTDLAIDFSASLDEEGTVIQTYIPKLDKALGGLWRKSLTVIAARPSVGKTALAWQVARNDAASGLKVLVASLEMAKRFLWARAVCGGLRVPYRDVLARRITPEQRERILEKNDELINLFAERLFVDDRTGLTTTDLWQEVAQLRPDVVVVDHLRLLADRVKNEKEDKRLGLISWNLKQIAKEFDCAVLCCAQLNRGVESREDKHPTMSDIRDSGQIEENADTILGLHRDRSALEQVLSTSPADVEILKFRDGPANVLVKLEFDGLAQWFN